MIKLTHELFDLETPLTVRHSNLHKTRNYLIEIPEQDELEADLVRLGILLPGRGLATGAPARCSRTVAVGRLRARRLHGRRLHRRPARRLPPRDRRLRRGVRPRPRRAHRRSMASSRASTAGAAPTPSTSRASTTWCALLRVMGAARSARAIENVRHVKSLKNDVNRRVNAETGQPVAHDQRRGHPDRAHRRGGASHGPRKAAACHSRVLRAASRKPRALARGPRCPGPASHQEVGHVPPRAALQALIEAVSTRRAQASSGAAIGSAHRANSMRLSYQTRINLATSGDSAH